MERNSLNKQFYTKFRGKEISKKLTKEWRDAFMRIGELRAKRSKGFVQWSAIYLNTLL